MLYMFRILLPSLLLAVCACGSTSGKQASVSAEENAETTSVPTLAFSGDSALALVSRQVEFGPRVPGSEAHARTAAWIQQRLEESGVTTTVQRTTLTAFDGTKLPVSNILASINPDAERRWLIVAHWDTRPWSDKDADSSRRLNPVDGANDGASGVGVLLELARVLPASLPADRGVDLLFVDAEDWGDEGSEESWAMGTRYFIQNPPQEWRRPEAGIVVDMVGDRDATFMREYFSEQAAPELNARIWGTAASLGYGERFLNRMGTAVTDDHVELIRGGIPAIDIIDFRDNGAQSGFCPQWHTSDDTMRHISPATLESVGRTLESFLTR